MAGNRCAMDIWKYEIFFFVNEYEEDNSDLLLTQEALSLIARKEPDFVYLYLVETDDKGGHDHGWMTPEYMHQVNNAFSCVQQVYEAVHDRYTIVITADHGGSRPRTRRKHPGRYDDPNVLCRKRIP